jgi:hypothetical protein
VRTLRRTASTLLPGTFERAFSASVAIAHLCRVGHRRVLAPALADIFESGTRVVRKARMPTRRGVLEFLGNQVLVSTVAWTAGLMAGRLVHSFFEVRSFRNLWGLASANGRALVSPDDYRAITALTSFFAGLVMLIVVRHFLLRLITEFRALRLERAMGLQSSSRSVVAPSCSGVLRADASSRPPAPPAPVAPDEHLRCRVPAAALRRLPDDARLRQRRSLHRV